MDADSCSSENFALSTLLEHEVVCKINHESATLITDMSNVPATLKDRHTMSLTKLQRSLGKCADELADAMDGFENYMTGCSLIGSR